MPESAIPKSLEDHPEATILARMYPLPLRESSSNAARRYTF
jgi:hypothetical protein